MLVATVTAGRSSSARTTRGRDDPDGGRAIGISVLLGADAADESLGATSTARGVAANGWVTAASVDGEAFLAADALPGMVPDHDQVGPVRRLSRPYRQDPAAASPGPHSAR